MNRRIVRNFVQTLISIMLIVVFSITAHSLTENYLKYMTPQYLEAYWWGGMPGESIDKYRTIIDKVIEKEKEFQETHYPFYNATTLDYLVLKDMFKSLQCQLKNVCWVDFEQFRSEHDLFKSMKSIDDFFDFMNKFPEDQRNDHNDAIRTVLLSVNLSFPGTISHDESTFYYFTAPLTQFVESEKAYYSHVRSMLVQFPQIKKLSNDKIDYFIKKIADLRQYFSQIKSGLLHQIFIPKKLVDTYVYLSGQYGHPYGQVEEYGVALKPFFTDLWNEGEQRFTKISPILDKLQVSPNIIEKDEYDYLQARIVLSKDLFASPDSGVKVFKYTMIDEKTLSKLNDDISKITEEITAAVVVKK